jgi:hypothetical protein
MPFSTNVDWLKGLCSIFNVSRNQNMAEEYHYYGAYDRLFNYAVIEGSFTFFLALQLETVPNETSPCDAWNLNAYSATYTCPIEFVIFMAVLNQEQMPVLIAEIKDDRWGNEPDKHQQADFQMHQHYDQMLPNCPIPCLYG